MTMPEDIEATAKKVVEFWLPPRDVRDAAIDSFDMDGLTNSVKEIIARAILAERQRCAMWAGWGKNNQECGHMAESIQEWILSGDVA